MTIKDKGRAAIAKKNKVLQRLAVEYVPIESIKPNQYNPNRQSEHDFELLVRSMMEDGFTQPIVVIRETREIVDGEHRWRAAQHLGFTEVPVVMVDMSPEQMRISTLRHNRARGSEDYELTAQLFADLRELGALDWAQDSLMLDDVELQQLLEDIPAPEVLAGDVYGEAWAVHEKDDAEVRADGSATSMTGAAQDAIRDREKAIREAKTEEERAAARRDSDIYRISMVFSGEEAFLIKKVLEPSPAEKLLELCILNLGLEP